MSLSRYYWGLVYKKHVPHYTNLGEIGAFKSIFAGKFQSVCYTMDPCQPRQVSSKFGKDAILLPKIGAGTVGTKTNKALFPLWNAIGVHEGVD